MKKTLSYLREHYVVILIIIISVFDIDKKLEEAIPHFHTYILGIVIIITIRLLMKIFQNSKNEITNHNTIRLTTSNDYTQKSGSLIFGIIGVVLCTYLLLYSSYYENIKIIPFLIISILVFIQSFYINRSLIIKVNQKELSYTVGKIKKSFDTEGLIKIKFTNTDIYFTKKDMKQHELSFLEITNNDIKIAVLFLNTKLKSDIAIEYK
jgi:hypothetical protein